MLLGVALLSACATSTVRTTQTTPIDRASPNLAESELLDVGVRLFDPGVEDIDEDSLVAVPEIRLAEARYMPTQLVRTMQGSGHWGAVRVVPEGMANTDVVVNGRILNSDGERLELEVTVEDSTGQRWFTREFSGLASKYAYSSKTARSVLQEPFQDVYNRIANDIAAYRGGMGGDEVAHLRRITELRFAESFSPESFGGTLSQDRQGIYQIQRLPAADDPMLDRIRRIRERDYLFVDTLQEYYGGFARQMKDPYQEWRRQSYTEAIAYRELRREATMRTLAGVAAVAAGIAGAGSNNGSTRAASNVAIVSGGYLIKSGFDKRAESAIHAEALVELAGSLQAEIQPQIIELEDQTITLTGTVEDQYSQWRGLLQDIYERETGDL
jgi:hypothetical protein